MAVHLVGEAEVALRSVIHKRLPELGTLERVLGGLADLPKSIARVEKITSVSYKDIEFPIHGIVLGTEDTSAPTLGFFGGVHGLERIGSEVVIAYLQTLSEVLQWDVTMKERLERSRLVFMPIVNPAGMFLTRRSNGNGIDLMRNSPIVAEQRPAFLVGGHQISPLLPWYRGHVKGPEDMEIEARAVDAFVRREIFPARLSLVVDVHSGFGSVDRLWFPYAKSRNPPPHLAEIAALKRLFDRSYPNHFYHIEPQAKNYTTHGDLWDWLYDEHQRVNKNSLFIPWALELGSWLWLKKNPLNIFSVLGPFNPVQPHRLQRILRRHLTLFDFLHRVLLSSSGWTEINSDTRTTLIAIAKEHWYK